MKSYETKRIDAENGQTDGQTLGYRDARTHLKTSEEEGIGHIAFLVFRHIL